VGSLIKLFLGAIFGWFVPAGAGNTTRSLIALIAVPVYSRWRGEHNGLLRDIAECGGLSPLARGTPLLQSV